MTDAELPNEQQPPISHLLLDFVKTRFWSLIGFALIVVGVLLYLGVDPSIPRYWTIFGAAFIASGLPAGFAVGTKVTSWLHNPREIWLVDLDARQVDGAIFRLSLDEFRDLQVTDEDGNPDVDYDLTELTPNLYVGKQLDQEEGTVVGTWRGTLDDVELARSLAAVRRCRGELQDKAQRGFAIETAAPAIVSNALRGEIDSLMKTIEAGTLPDEGDAVTDAIEERLDDLGFDDHLGAIVDDLESDPETEPDDSTGEFDIDLDLEEIENQKESGGDPDGW
ncbi:hypothetical protein SY89_02255 [Halolamina pelagica]|uniref:DUF8125 domain-containing protein n=1 Tax=Halolamina pelagica TaxID=699431 RepID=A0A0P7GQN4_9EURY|nr:hypothetical protein [Halolamina pelagica]KPN31508.1 hypothetical protein SY89_02255 [Halolamina pelagica]